MSEQYLNEERRDVSGFSALVFKGMGRVDLVQGDHDELVIEALPEICSRIQTTVTDNTLLIDYAEDWKDWTGFRTLSGDKIRFGRRQVELHHALSRAGVQNRTGQRRTDVAVLVPVRLSELPSAREAAPVRPVGGVEGERPDVGGEDREHPGEKAER